MLPLELHHRSSGFSPALEYKPLSVSRAELDPDGIPYMIMRWPDAYKAVGNLANQIKESREKFDVIMGIRRGGLFPAGKLSERLNLPFGVISADHYQGIQAVDSETMGDLHFYDEIRVPEGVDMHTARILLADEVNDRGDTIEGVSNYLKQLFGNRPAAVAVMHEKSRARVKTKFVAGRTDAWIVYPWEHEGSLEAATGEVLHKPYEFFVEKLPVWMIREGNKPGTVAYEFYQESMERAQTIGFKPYELPSLDDDDFRGRLETALGKRHEELFHVAVGETIIFSLLF